MSDKRRIIFNVFDIPSEAIVGQVFTENSDEAVAMVLRMGGKEGGFYVRPASAMSDDAIPYQVGKLELREGDILVLKLTEHAPSSAIKHLEEQFAAFGRKHKVAVMLLTSGMDLSAVSREGSPSSDEGDTQTDRETKP